MLKCRMDYASQHRGFSKALIKIFAAVNIFLRGSRVG